MTQRPMAISIDTRGTRLLAEWTRQRMDEVAHEATKAIWREVPGYHQYADLTLFSEVEAHCQQVFGVFLSGITQQRHPLERDFPWTERHAMRRVDLGISLSDFLKAFRIGQITLWDDIMRGVETRSVSNDAALHVVGEVLRTIEVGSSVAAQTYLEAQQYQVADSARLARDLLEDLLAGRPPRVRERQRALDQIGLTEDAHLLVVVAALPDIDPTDLRRRQQVRQALTGSDRGLFVGRQDELVALLPVPHGVEAKVLSAVRSAITSLAGGGLFLRAGVSATHQGYAAVPDAYEEARLAQQALTGPGLRSLSEMSTLDLLVSSQDGLSRMVPGQVRDFIEEDLATGGVLVDTLSAYVTNDLNARETALHLNNHVNTVYYRLGRIADHTGRDVRSAADLIDLLLAVRLVRAEQQRG